MKKLIAAGTMGLLMAGSTIAFAQLSSFPQPFVTSGGTIDSVIVVGAAAMPQDVVSAIDIGARLGGEVYTPVSTSGSTEVTVQGGVPIYTANEKIYLDDSLKKTGLRTSMSSSEFPTMLASGTVDGDDGDYDYDLFIDFTTSPTLQFKKGNDDDSAKKALYMFGPLGSASATNYLYRSRVVFNDEPVRADTANEEITLFGKTYTYGSTSDLTATKVTLFGSSDTKTIQEGETVTVTVDGTSYDVTVAAVSDSDTASITVGGETKTFDKGQTKAVGGINLFLDEVVYSAKESTINYAVVGVGARKIILTDGASVKTQQGTESEKTVDGTFVDLIANNGNTTGIDIYVTANSNNDEFFAGKEITDPVYGSFKIAFSSISAGMTDDNVRDKISVTPDGSTNVDLQFTNDRGNTGTISWAHTTSTSDTDVELGDNDDADSIKVVENQTILKNEYFVVDSGDFSRIFEVTSANSLGTTDAKLEIKDVMSGNTIEINLGISNGTSKVIDGQTYYFNASAAGDSDQNLNLRVTWGNGSSLKGAGDFVTVYPVLKTKKGAKIALTENVTVGGLNGGLVSGSIVQLPTGAFSINAWDATTMNITASKTESGDTTQMNASSTAALNLTTDAWSVVRISKGGNTDGVLYALNPSSTPGSLQVSLASDAATPVLNASVLVIEEQDDSSNMHTVRVTASVESSADGGDTQVNAPVFTYSSDSASDESDSKITHYVDFWGTYAIHNTDGQDKVDIWYPDTQVSANVVILSSTGSVSTDSTSSGTVKSTNPIKTSIAMLDTDAGIEAAKTSKNLILVGGPFVNSLVKTLADGGKTWAGQRYLDEGSGTYIVQYVSNAFTNGKAALIVAGTSAADTRAASLKVQSSTTGTFTGAINNTAWYKGGVMQSSAA